MFDRQTQQTFLLINLKSTLHCFDTQLNYHLELAPLLIITSGNASDKICMVSTETNAA
jgi:hypothetical protein